MVELSNDEILTLARKAEQWEHFQRPHIHPYQGYRAEVDGLVLEVSRVDSLLPFTHDHYLTVLSQDRTELGTAYDWDKRVRNLYKEIKGTVEQRARIAAEQDL